MHNSHASRTIPLACFLSIALAGCAARTGWIPRETPAVRVLTGALAPEVPQLLLINNEQCQLEVRFLAINPDTGSDRIFATFPRETCAHGERILAGITAERQRAASAPQQQPRPTAPTAPPATPPPAAPTSGPPEKPQP